MDEQLTILTLETTPLWAELTARHRRRKPSRKSAEDMEMRCGFRRPWKSSSDAEPYTAGLVCGAAEWREEREEGGGEEVEGGG